MTTDLATLRWDSPADLVALRASQKISRKDLSVPYSELPISSYSGWDRVWQIENVLSLHDHGQFRDSAILLDSMMRCDRIAAVSDTRMGALLASPVQIKPAGASAQAAEYAAELGGEQGDEQGLWPRMFPQDVVGQLQFWGRWLGVAVAEILWDLTPERWTPRLRVWHPQFLQWDWMQYRYYLICQEGIVTLPDTDQEIHGNGRWLVWAPHGYRYGWLRSFVRRLAHKYIMRGWDYRDWARFNERHGQPILGAVIPPGLKKEEKDAYLAALGNLGAEGLVPLPAGEDGAPGFDLKLIEAKSRTYESFERFGRKIDDDIAITVLGQNLTTEVQGGSYAAAQVQDRVRIDKRIEDAAIANVLRDQVLWWDALYNYGDGNLAPIAQYQVEPPEDEIDAAAALEATGKALQALEAGAPGMVDKRAVLERAGAPVLTDEEIAANEAERAEQAAQAAQAAAAAQDPAMGDKADAPGGAPRKTKLSAVDSRVVNRYEFAGLPIAVENPAGTDRTWIEQLPDGGQRIGTTRMLHDYGFIEGHMGADGEELDVYIGPDQAAPNVHVVHQRRAPDFTAFDEDKVFLGFPSADAAHDAFRAHRDDDRAFGGMTTVPLDVFKAKLRRRSASGGKIRASALAPAALEASMSALVGRLEALKATSPRTPGGRRQRVYGDLVADRAIAMAARIMGPDLDRIRTAIEGAGGDFTRARTAILEAYRSAKPEKLAEIVRKARLMAHVGGLAAEVKHR